MKRRDLILAGLMAIGYAAIPQSALAAPGSASTAQLEVTYNYLPPSPICARIKPAVSGLEQDFPGKVKARNLDATTPENKKIVKDLGFQSHGLVIRSADGKPLWKQPDHDVSMEDVRKAIAELLKK